VDGLTIIQFNMISKFNTYNLFIFSPINKFKGSNPSYFSIKNCYKYISYLRPNLSFLTIIIHI